MIAIALFNNKGGVGKTSLVYHLAWKFSDLNKRVVVADLDPQANLSSMFLIEDRFEELWQDQEHKSTIFGCITPITKGIGDISNPEIEEINDNIGLIVGDLGLSTFEDYLSQEWPNCLDGREASFRITSAFYRILLKASDSFKADIVLIDVGPNLGAINRAALISADYIIIPLVPDLFSLQGIKNLGPTLFQWRNEWKERLKKKPQNLELPSANMKPLGYIVLQHRIRLDRPVISYEKWAKRIPNTYRRYVLKEDTDDSITIDNDPHCLYLLKHYGSMMPMAMETRKPIFHLLPADGAIGAHQKAVQSCDNDFKKMVNIILSKLKSP